MNHWADVLDDDCRCRWVNRSENGGWDLVARNPECPVHGDCTCHNEFSATKHELCCGFVPDGRDPNCPRHGA